MLTRAKNALEGLRRGWRQPPPIDGRSWRPTWLPCDVNCIKESDAHPHIAAELADMFIAHNTGSTEVETLNWLHATVCLTKASCVLETGAADGLGTIALAAACRDNGFGRVHSVEIDRGLCERLRARLKELGLSHYAEVHCEDSRAFLEHTALVFDFAFFDSLVSIRVAEYDICRRRGILRGVAAFHDTSPHRTQSLTTDPGEPAHSEYRRSLHNHAQSEENAGHFETALSRGLFVIFPGPSLRTTPAESP